MMPIRSTEERYRTDSAGLIVAPASAQLRPIELSNAYSNCQEELRAEALPTMATANDVREVVQYLKQRPEGVNICDVVQPIKKRIFYPAKVAAYEFWGLVTRTRERVKLTALGWEFARCLEPETAAYRALINGTDLYRRALQWIHDQGLDLVTTNDIASYWQSHFSAEFGDEQSNDLCKTVVSYFHLCQAAELGTMTIGKRGQPARLRVWRTALAGYLKAYPERVGPRRAVDEAESRIAVARVERAG